MCSILVIFGIFLLILATFLITGCEVNENPFLGTWKNPDYGTIKVTKTEWTWIDNNSRSHSGSYTADGDTATYQEQTGSFSGTATAIGNTLRVKYSTYIANFSKQ
jgi:hypothetical protein